MAPQVRPLPAMLATLALLLALCVPAQTALSAGDHGATARPIAQHLTLPGTQLDSQPRPGEPHRPGTPLTPAAPTAILLTALAYARRRGRRRTANRSPAPCGSRSPPLRRRKPPG